MDAINSILGPETVDVTLTAKQVDFLRGVIYEYFRSRDYLDAEERVLHGQLEDILADADRFF